MFRSDDLEFTVAARGWGECVSFGNFDLYERRFMETAGEYLDQDCVIGEDRYGKKDEWHLLDSLELSAYC